MTRCDRKRVALFSVLALLPVLCGETTAQCEIGRLTPSDGAGGDQFGFWLAVDGGTSLVGAFEHGDGGALQVTFAGTHEGVFQGLEPSGRPFQFEFVGVFRFEGDKVVEERVFYDRLEIAEKLRA